jgi:hypothetical protein
MNPLMIIGALAGGASSVFQLIDGIKQRREANRLQERVVAAEGARPGYTRPEEAVRALTLAQQSYADPYMPGENRMLDRVSLSQNNALEAARLGGNPYASIGAAQGQADLANERIGIQSAQFRNEEENRLMNMLQMMGSYTDQEFQMNEFAPWADNYQRLLNEQRDKAQGAGQNIFQGLEGIGGIGMNLMMGRTGIGGGQSGGVDYDALQGILDKYGGGGGQGTGMMGATGTSATTMAGRIGGTQMASQLARTLQMMEMLNKI